MSDDNSVIVIDNGSGICKAGFAGEDKPSAMVPTIIGRPKEELFTAQHGESLKGTCVGQDAVDKRDMLDLTYPVERGVVQNWDDMEQVWKHVFTSALKVDPKDHSVLMVENYEFEVNKKNRAKIYEIMFENFQVAGMQMAMDSVLSLWASGRKTGIVCTSGDTLSHVVPVYEGYQLSEAMMSVHLGGRDVTEYLGNLLIEKGYSLATGGENRWALLNDVKEKFAYVALDFEKEMSVPSSSLEQRYSFANGDEIVFDQERFRCTEALFDPSLIGIQSPGLDALIYDSIMKCDMDVRRDLYHNIVLAGGTTLSTGFVDRIKKGLVSLVPPTINIQISAPNDRAISAWVGGSILASSNDFNRQTMTNQQYAECGVDYIPLCSGIF